MSNIDSYNERVFEEYRHVNDYGEDYWYARDLQEILQYSKWENFSRVIDKAKEACETVAITF